MENQAINKVFSYIQDFLNGKVDALDFSYDLQSLLSAQCKNIDEEDPKVCQLLHDELPFICDEYEMGDDPERFKSKIRKEFERIKKAM